MVLDDNLRQSIVASHFNILKEEAEAKRKSHRLDYEQTCWEESCVCEADTRADCDCQAGH